LGVGLEIINTTSDLNRQGTVTVWRQEEAVMPVGNFGVLTAPTTPVFFRHQSVQYYRPPPFNIANAMLYPGSRQWRAADGAYIVQTFTSAENPPTFVGYVQPVVANAISDDVETTPATIVTPANVSNLWVPSLFTYAGTAGINQAIRLHPLNMAGAMFTGLSTQTTLTLNVNIYYESFPSVAEAGILVLAKPSAAYDPVALEFMSRINSSLAVGVPASWNPEGEWFWEIVNDLVDMAPAIGGLFGPAGALIGKGVQSGYNTLTDRYTKENNEARATARADKRKKENEKEAKMKAAAKNRQTNRQIKAGSTTAPGDTAPKPSRARKPKPKK